MLIFLCRDFINKEIINDQEDPKEPSHFDYKYLKSKAGPLYKGDQKESDNETHPLVNKNTTKTVAK